MNGKDKVGGVCMCVCDEKWRYLNGWEGKNGF